MGLIDEEEEWFNTNLSMKASELVDQNPQLFNLMQPRLISNALRDVVRAYNSEGIRFVFDHSDTFLSILVNATKLDWNVLDNGFEYLERSCRQLTTQLEETFQEKDIDREDRVYFLKCLKWKFYLFTEFMKAKDAKLASQAASTLTIGKRKKANVDNNPADGEWKESERRTALEIIFNALQLPLHRLWEPPLADDAFVDMMAQPCYRIMEDPIIKSKPTRETVFQILGVLNKKYNHGLSCTIKLVQMVQLYEHAVPSICAGICQLVTGCGLQGLVARLVRELGEALGGGDGPADDGLGAAQRNCAQFLSELTQLMPAQMIPAAQAMRSHLENDESYPLRISVLGMLCEIICRELKGEGLSDDKRNLRDEFLDDLAEHIHDLSAFVRARVLQNWVRLQREGCVPISRQQTVLARAIGRLQDRTALVRRNAMQLVKVFLEHNPYSAELKLSSLEKQLVLEKENLEAIKRRLNLVPDAKLVKEWDEIKNDILECIQEKLNDPPEESPLAEEKIDDPPAAIRNYILGKKYYEAYLVVEDIQKQLSENRASKFSNSDEKITYMLLLLRDFYITDREKLHDPNSKENAELIKKLEEKENVVAFLEDSVSFSQLIQQAIPLVYTLLMSKQSTDVNEAIDFFITAHNFNIETAKLGVMGMLQLVWSPDQEKRDAVENAYRQIYLNTDGNTERIQSANTAKALVKLAMSVNRGQAAALQVLLSRWFKAEHLHPSVIQVLWEMFTMKHGETSDDDSYAALSVLTMLAKSKSSIASANIELIQNIGLTNTYRKKVLSLQLLLCLTENRQPLPMTHSLFESLTKCILETFYKSKKFSAFGTNAINVIYALCDTPDLLCVKILRELTEKLKNYAKNDGNDDISMYPVQYISRIILLLGQVALQQLIYLDLIVYGELRRRNEIRDQRKTIGNKNKIASKERGKSEVSFNASSASAAGRAHRLHNQTSSTVNPNEAGEEADEAGLEGAVADDADAELIRTVCDREIVCEGLLSKASSIIRNLLQGTALNNHNDLKASACLTLGRFMLVSSTFCEEHMQLFMSLLKNSTCSTMRCNIVITLADLTLRFPNIVQPWTPYIYERLEDPCVEVRQCTVKMLSFLILQEMVRVRGQVAGLARCCVDSDPSIRNMTRLFFKQLSQKGNSLYNIIPDIISQLSDPSLNLPEDDFRVIIKYVMSLIQKDRQMEALVEKLCLRFKLSNNERQWRDLAYCLSLFTYNERSIRKLIENIDCYKDKLFCKEVYNCFNIIITNANKLAKQDLKTIVSELSDRIEEVFSLTETNEENEEGNRSKVSATPKSRKAAPPRRPRQRKSNSDSDDDSDIENMTPSKNTNVVNGRSSARKRAPLRYQNNESDESDEEEFVQKKTTEKNDVFKKPVGRAGRKRK